MDENTRRLFCCRKVVVKKDWKTTLLLLPDIIFATEVEWSSSLSLPWLFCSRIVFLSFHSFLVSVLFSCPFLLALNFYGKFLTPSSIVNATPWVSIAFLSVEILNVKFQFCSLFVLLTHKSQTIGCVQKFYASNNCCRPSFPGIELHASCNWWAMAPNTHRSHFLVCYFVPIFTHNLKTVGF